MDGPLEAAVVAGMFFLRIGVPLIITLAAMFAGAYVQGRTAR